MVGGGQDLSMKLIVDGTPISPINTQDSTLVGFDFTTYVSLTTSSDTLTAGTHNATLVLLQELGVVFFNNLIYTPTTVEPSASNSTPTAHSLILEEQEYKETSTAAQQRPFSFGRSQSIVATQHVDIEVLPDQQKAAATTTTRTPSIASELSPRGALPALPAPPSTANPNQFEIIERLISQNVPRQDIISILRTMAAAGPSGSVAGDQQRAEAVQRQPNTHTSEMEIEMPQQGEGQHPPTYDFKNGRWV
ncbi:hypothetical protein FRB94_003110 [Tulasnella sp. JGI-2019a]|nr:hypothetical protein FRB94_003110 [Tulasnella sp. JGI-2019a]KAG9017793.1 hypothetical protein FRB93_004604 [Tulasnella sp. JGI-2019a]